MLRGTKGTSSPGSPGIFPCTVPLWLEFSIPSPPPSPHILHEFPPKATILTILTIFWIFLISFTNMCVIPTIFGCFYYWFCQFLAVLSFLFILIFWFRKKSKIILFKISNWLQIWNKILPEIPQTQNSGNRCYFPWSPRNDKLPFPNSPKLQGKKI